MRFSRRFLLAFFLAAAMLAACSPPAPRFKSTDIGGVEWGGDFTLTAHTGKPVKASEFIGKVVILFFGYTHCPDICPVHLANIAAALDKSSPEVNNGIKVVFVTTDPARDTPAVMRAWLDKFDRRFIGLWGDSAQIVGALRQVRLGAPTREQLPNDTTYYVGHAAFVLAFTRDDLAHVVYPFGIRQADWVKDLRKMVTGS